MASSLSSVTLVPVASLTARSTVLRPSEAGVPTAFNADTLRRDEALRAETIDEVRRRDAGETSEGASGGQADSQPAPRRSPPANSAAFVAQLLAQDQPAERRSTPFADAAQAYGRFREEPTAGFVLDPPQRVDLKV